MEGEKGEHTCRVELIIKNYTYQAEILSWVNVEGTGKAITILAANQYTRNQGNTDKERKSVQLCYN